MENKNLNITEDQRIKEEIVVNEQIDEDDVAEALAQEDFDDELNEDDDTNEIGKMLFEQFGYLLKSAA